MLKILLSLFFVFYAVNVFAWEDRVQQQPWKYASISTATTTIVKTGQGILHNILVTGGTAGTISVYNNTIASGDTLVALFSSTNAIASYPFDIAFSSGCTVVTGGATNITVTYL